MVVVYEKMVIVLLDFPNLLPTDSNEQTSILNPSEICSVPCAVRGATCTKKNGMLQKLTQGNPASKQKRSIRTVHGPPAAMVSVEDCKEVRQRLWRQSRLVVHPIQAHHEAKGPLRNGTVVCMSRCCFQSTSVVGL